MDLSVINKNFLKNNYIITHRKNFDKLKPTTHYHNTYELFLLVNGRGNFFIKDNTYPMKPGSIFLIDEFDIHKTTINKKDFYYERFVLYLKKDYIKNLFSKLGENYDFIDITSRDNRQIIPTPSQFNRLTNLYEKTILEQNQRKLYSNSLINSYLIQIYVLFLRIINNKGNEVEGMNETNRRLQEIVSYLNNNFRKNLTLKKIADKFFISKYYLSHFFKEKTGFTIIEYLNHKRVLESQILLETSQKSITDIAFNVGFNSLTHFSRTFKLLTGLTPSQFRKIKVQD